MLQVGNILIFWPFCCKQIPAELDDFNLAEALGSSPDGIGGVGMRVCKLKKICGKKKTTTPNKGKKAKAKKGVKAKKKKLQ